jgi:hypothetical protein
VEEPRSFSLSGLGIGAAIGLTSGLALDYLILFWHRFLPMLWPGPSLEALPLELWFLPVLLVCTGLGALYYGAEV